MPTPVKNSNTLSEGRKSQSTTSGRTSIFGKYYPHRIRPWDDFRHACHDAFERVRAVLGDSSRLPSIMDVDAAKRSVDEQLPLAFLDSEHFRNEAKTSFVIHEALERPAQHVMNAYLEAVGSQVRLYFDNRSAGWQARVRPPADAARSEASSSVQVSDERNAGVVAQKPGVTTQPDCLVLASTMPSPPAETAGEGQREHAGRPRSVYRVLMGEHKSVHRIRAQALSRFNHTPLPEDIMVQLAKVNNKTLHGRQHSGGSPSDVNTMPAPRLLPGQIYFINALTQTFHYMVTSGVEYSFLASGETLTFLRLSGDDPTTLSVHTEAFPQHRQTMSQMGMGGIHELPISRLCGLCMLAFESTPEPPRQRSMNVFRLALFPELPPSHQPRPSLQSGPSSSPQRDDNDDHDDGHDDDHDIDTDTGDRGHGSPSNADGSSSSRPQPSVYQPPKSSPLKLKDKDRKKRRITSPSLPSPFDPSTFRPIRPYCTQACLRGLLRGENVDRGCPNVLLHLEAQRHACHPKGPRWARRHAITGDELRELVRHQLLENSELDCQCLLDDGARGAIGCLFKITVTGFGYTLVAKGVETLHSRRLRHEMRVYDKLDTQQGLLIPVCLGTIKLFLPYPMVNCTLITHMLLMSYAGEPLYRESSRQALERAGIDVDEEERRTIQELQAVGLTDGDDISNGNVMWCAETKRVMKIDFDQAYVSTVNSDQVRETSTTSSGSTTGDGLLPSAEPDDDWRGFRDSSSLHSTVDCLLLA
ncbi:hypothetical protein GMORB2_6735 [Geosmithia morbida]|uniref:Uncharacterized protein n=1 Tax=Geosmithia morbida TaxID=1094350 RepID=A0A9P5D4W8_9HYPO|nr:uncharacterized protein GMORB2_6735 [Geosmithia morbida]KAF4123185.1 hypothetical protein GMORB2_6735 [Geosmithia morbida]